MSRNGAGVYSLPAPPSPLVNGQTVDATNLMTMFSDLATAMTASIAADGQTPITGTLDFNGNNANDVGQLSAKSVVTSAGVTVGTTLGVTGATTLSDTLSVGGSATFSASAKFGAAVSTISTLAVGTSATVGTTLAVTGTATAANGTSGSQVVNYSQFPATLTSPGTMTLPNGLIVKWGTWSTVAGVGSVAFATAFPTAVLNIQLSATGASGGATTFSPVASGVITVSGFNVRGDGTQNLNGYWLALGY